MLSDENSDGGKECKGAEAKGVAGLLHAWNVVFS